MPSDRVVPVLKATPTFRPWSGVPIQDTYGNKPILELDGEPVFAELVILRLLQREGWKGVWVDSYRRKYRVGYWGEDNEMPLPAEREDLLEQIREELEGRGGCWDVYCWKGRDILFAESKWSGKDIIRETQLRWLEGALSIGLPLRSFLLVEWSFKRT